MTRPDRDRECVIPGDQSREAIALAALTRCGYVEEFVVRDGAVHIANTTRRFRPEDLHIRDYYRFEGASDPDDMSVIYALEARDGTRGTLTDAFGTYADPAIGAAINRMRVVPFNPRHPWRRTLMGAAVGALTVAATIAIARRRAA
jgi:hypothetical protein